MAATISLERTNARGLELEGDPRKGKLRTWSGQKVQP